MISWPILTTITFLPLAGAALILICRLFRGGADDVHGAATARWIALWTTLLTGALSLFMWWHFD
ncbi:MAG: NADH-quinone oxidoreductase subunit M, partial [Pseudomonadota bacterium]